MTYHDIAAVKVHEMKAVEVAAKAKTEVKTVKMTDGREIAFTGKRKMIKTTNAEQGTVRFDFVNGETRLFTIPETLFADCAVHGASQKIGDEAAGETDVEDAIVAIDAAINRLSAGEWGATREAGDGFSGASVIIRAIAEVTSKSMEEVKTFLQGKLDAAKTKGEKLSRQQLYASFRASAKIGPIIERLEKEKVKKASTIDADAMMNELA